jgi:hypothetical protein
MDEHLFLTRESNRPFARRVFCRVRLTVGVLLWLAGTASAQQDLAGPVPAPEETVRYTVELIIFTYESASSAGNEIFTPPQSPSDGPFGGPPAAGISEEGPVFDDRMAPVETVGDEETGSLREIPAGARIELERLEPEAFQMQDAYRKLRQLDAYRPILHTAWTQTTHEKSMSPALPLRALGDPPLGLNGSITLYQSRFLHLDVDLTLDAAGAVAGSARRTATDRLVNPGSAAEGTPPGDENGAFQQPPLHYRITEDRIMRDGDIRYFDHPHFGMLARGSRVRNVEESPAAD